jgi:hypothetical protein
VNTISPLVSAISAILIVVVLIVAFKLREKIKKNERGNEFFPWEREAAQGGDMPEDENDPDDIDMNEVEDDDDENEED